jgi:16S rRNA (guanine(966)-N(2))-methyltransferase RsmD
MRIVSGKYKGRRFELPKDLKARPTTDFAKEGLFNILNNRIDFENINILDLFSGTGSIAFEFISRGAARATCIEQYPPHVKFIRNVASKLGEDVIVIQGDAYKFISGTHQKFDIIFADAPYADKDLPKIPELIFKADILDDDGLLIVEHSSKTDFSKETGFIEKRSYGSVNFSFFEK